MVNLAFYQELKHSALLSWPCIIPQTYEPCGECMWIEYLIFRSLAKSLRDQIEEWSVGISANLPIKSSISYLFQL